MRVLILFAHPALEKSRVHRQLVRSVADLPGITFHDLYEAYPRFDIDVAREQQLLLEHELIVIQHPLYWYSVPALLKQWIDLVLEHGWAYGSTGRALEGKYVLPALSTGGRAAAYQPDGYNGHTIGAFLAPLAQTVRLCRMHYLAPFVIHGTHQMQPPAILHAAERYRQLIAALRDERIDLPAAARGAALDLDAVLKPEVAQ